MTPTYLADADRCRIATEILELGETLFDVMLEAAARGPATDMGEPFPEAELRSAANEFIKSLRLLLGLPTHIEAKDKDFDSMKESVAS